MQTDFIESKRYTPIEIIGQGTWGTVWKAEDTLYQSKDKPSYVAIKVLTPSPLAEQQMNQRNIDSFKAMKKEHRFAPARHVLQGMLDIDISGKPFIVMPLCRESLSDRLKKGSMSKETSQKLSLDIARGLSELHTIYNQIHGDLKADNILIDYEGVGVITDFGTATMLDESCWSVSPRDNMGEIQIRAPELLKEGSHPTAKSDIYSASSLIARLLSPNEQYPFEGYFKTSDEARVFFSSQNQRSLDKIVKEKLELIPFETRSVLRRGLSLSQENRQYNGHIFYEELNESMDEKRFSVQTIKALKNLGLVIGLPLLASTVGYFAGMSHYKEFDSGLTGQPLKGILHLPNPDSEPIVAFKQEKLDLPLIKEEALWEQSREIDRLSLKATDGNYTRAHLVASYRRMMGNRGTVRHDFTDYQKNSFVGDIQIPLNMSSDEAVNYMQSQESNILKVINSSLKKAIDYSFNPESKTIDLEDVCAISRLGPSKIDLAKRVSNRTDFKDYSLALDNRGQRIIPEQEVEIIKTWLSYINDMR